MGHRCHAWIADILKNVIKIGILSKKSLAAQLFKTNSTYIFFHFPSLTPNNCFMGYYKIAILDKLT